MLDCSPCNLFQHHHPLLTGSMAPLISAECCDDNGCWWDWITVCIWLITAATTSKKTSGAGETSACKLKLQFTLSVCIFCVCICQTNWKNRSQSPRQTFICKFIHLKGPFVLNHSFNHFLIEWIYHRVLQRFRVLTDDESYQVSSAEQVGSTVRNKSH
jgi:hypothetical protein